MDENFSLFLKMSPVGQDFIAQMLRKESRNDPVVFFV